MQNVWLCVQYGQPVPIVYCQFAKGILTYHPPVQASEPELLPEHYCES